MPPATLDNAAMSMSQNTAQREYDGSVPMTKKGFSTKTPSADDDTVSFRKQTRTWNYVWRSGVAGGLAGCAVRLVLQVQARGLLGGSCTNVIFLRRQKRV